MFWYDAHAPGPQSWRKGLLVNDSKSIGVQHLCLFNQLVVASANRIGLFIHDLIVSELYIFSSKFLSIVPENTLSQGKSNLWFFTFFNFPGFRQFSDKALEVTIVFDQSIENEAIDVTGGRILGKNGIEKGGIADGADDQLVDPLRRSGTDEDNINPQEDEEKDGEDEEKSFNPQRTFPF